MAKTNSRAFDAFLQEFKYAVRSFWKTKAFTLVAVVTLGLGIGANSAGFTLVNAVLLKGLPYRGAGRLVHVWETAPSQRSGQVSYPDFQDIVERSTSFEGVAGYAFDGFALKTGEGSERVSAGRVSANFFDVLGVKPALGRSFLPEEDRPLMKRSAALISYGLWQRRFGGDPGVIGRSIPLSDNSFTVIGVLPREFHFARLGDPEVFVTLSPSKEAVERRFMHWMWAVGRLKDGATQESANEDLTSIALARERTDPRWHKETGLRVAPLREALVGPIGPVVLGLFAAVGAVLLIACANVANMLLARGMGRKREIGIRLAMGASRSRIVSQFLMESVLLSLLGGAAGLLWAGGGVRALIAAIPASMSQGLPFLRELAVDQGVLGFTFAVCFATGLLFGLIPALHATSAGLAESLKDGARGSSGRQHLRSALVAAEIAIALSLVASTGLLGRSLNRLLEVNPGFDTANLLTARVAVPERRYDSPAKLEAFFDRWQERIGALPGVKGVALVDRLPLLGAGNTGTPTVAGRNAAGSEAPDSDLRTVSESYFRVMGLPLVSGRAFAPSDRVDATRVVVINRTFVKEIFGGEEPVGRTLTFAFIDGPLEVVGVVGDEKAGSLDGRVRPVLYFPWRQEVDSATSAVLRLEASGSGVGASLGSESRSLEPDAIVSAVRTMDEIIASGPATFLRRYPLMILGGFSFLALVLASVGIYGVTMLSVSERTSEIGIRMALGAQTAAIVRLVLSQGMRVALLGVGAGVATGLAVARVLSSALYETPPADPMVFAGAALILTAVAAAALYLPARRASRVDPLIAVRRD